MAKIRIRLNPGLAATAAGSKGRGVSSSVMTNAIAKWLKTSGFNKIKASDIGAYGDNDPDYVVLGDGAITLMVQSNYTDARIGFDEIHAFAYDQRAHTASLPTAKVRHGYSISLRNLAHTYTDDIFKPSSFAAEADKVVKTARANFKKLNKIHKQNSERSGMDEKPSLEALKKYDRKLVHDERPLMANILTLGNLGGDDSYVLKGSKITFLESRRTVDLTNLHQAASIVSGMLDPWAEDYDYDELDGDSLVNGEQADWLKTVSKMTLYKIATAWKDLLPICYWLARNANPNE